MTALESVVSQSMASTAAHAPEHTGLANPLQQVSQQNRKRSSTEAFGIDYSAREPPYIKSGSDFYSTPPFSAYEAQNLIQQELSSTVDSNKSQRSALHSALSSLKQRLNTTIPTAPSHLLSTSEDLQRFPMPSVELIQWMLQCIFYLPVPYT